MSHDHPAHVGPVGILGSTSANELAAEADVILAVGTRLQDFTTGSWTAFAADAKFISVNAARWDAVKHRALAVVGDARETIGGVGRRLGRVDCPVGWTDRGRRGFAGWNTLLDGLQRPTNAPVPTYAQVVGVVNAKAGERDLLVTAAGGLPGEVMKNWRVKAPGTFDCEFGFSCMGYEIAAGWGAAMADPTRTPIVMVGDGTYLMMNSDVYSSVLVRAQDDPGRMRQWRLRGDQPAAERQGCASFNNLIRDCRVKEPFAVDFAKHAESMGALVRVRKPDRARRRWTGPGRRTARR